MRKLKLNIKAAEDTAKTINKEIIELNKNYEDVKAQCNLITENIYLSSFKKAQDLEYLKDNEFTHIINCAPGSKNFTPVQFMNFEYISFDIKDEPGYDLTSVIFKFIELIEQIEVKCERRSRVLVHCFEGISRGPALIISYLMWKNKWSFETAHEYVKSRRNCIDLNLGFCSQLKKLSELLCLNQEERLYKIDGMNNIRLVNKKELTSDELVYSSAIVYMKNNTIHRLLLRQSSDNLDNLCKESYTLLSLIKKFENCKEECLEVNHDINCIINREEIFKNCM